ELVAADALVAGDELADVVAADELVAVAALVAGDIPVVAAALVVAAAELAALTAGVGLSRGCLSCVTGGMASRAPGLLAGTGSPQ
ncbi:hypothetical protein L0N33_21190, partial [Roseburia faecis]|nr:hypothetical protein [Roseburia faecis]